MECLRLVYISCGEREEFLVRLRAHAATVAADLTAELVAKTGRDDLRVTFGETEILPCP